MMYGIIVIREGPTEIRTRIAGFKVQSANHYTIRRVTMAFCHYEANQLKPWRGNEFSSKKRSYRDLNSDRWIQSPKC